MKNLNQYFLLIKKPFFDSFLKINSYDVFPEFSKKFRKIIYTPFSVLFCTGLIGLFCGFFLHPQGFALAVGIFVILIMGLIFPFVTLYGISITLFFPKTSCIEGEPVEIILKIKNKYPWPGWGITIQDDSCDIEIENNIYILFSNIISFANFKCSWFFTPLVRGRYPKLTTKLLTSFPFDLITHKKKLLLDNKLIVWPKTYDVCCIPFCKSEDLLHGNFSRNKAGNYGDVLGVRPYRSGDSTRRIHWAQSAKHDKLIVCELQSISRPSIHLLLDSNKSSHTETGVNSSFECSVRIIASFAKSWILEGATVSLSANKKTINASSGEKHLEVIMNYLSEIQTDVDDSFLLNVNKLSDVKNRIIVSITTDIGKANLHLSKNQENQIHWVILKKDNFENNHSNSNVNTHLNAWIFINNNEEMPSKILTQFKGG